MISLEKCFLCEKSIEYWEINNSLIGSCPDSYNGHYLYIHQNINTREILKVKFDIDEYLISINYGMKEFYIYKTVSVDSLENYNEPQYPEFDLVTIYESDSIPEFEWSDKESVKKIIMKYIKYIALS